MRKSVAVLLLIALGLVAMGHDLSKPEVKKDSALSDEETLTHLRGVKAALKKQLARVNVKLAVLEPQYGDETMADIEEDVLTGMENLLREKKWELSAEQMKLDGRILKVRAELAEALN